MRLRQPRGANTTLPLQHADMAYRLETPARPQFVPRAPYGDRGGGERSAAVDPAGNSQPPISGRRFSLRQRVGGGTIFALHMETSPELRRSHARLADCIRPVASSTGVRRRSLLASDDE